MEKIAYKLENNIKPLEIFMLPKMIQKQLKIYLKKHWRFSMI